jgi:hypothetical protein
MRVSQKVHRRLRVRARHELGYCIVQERPGVLRGAGLRAARFLARVAAKNGIF